MSEPTRDCTDVRAAILGTPAFAQLVNLRARRAALARDLDAIAARLTEIGRQRRRLTASWPKGLAERLAEFDAEARKQGEARQAKLDELAAIDWKLAEVRADVKREVAGHADGLDASQFAAQLDALLDETPTEAAASSE
jgi:hypothetical protein